MFFKLKKEKILPQIKFKYLKGSASKDKSRHPDMTCSICRKRNIILGSASDAYSDNPKFICEDCTVDIFKREHGFKSRKAAAARRRRMFDVGYLFNEMVADKYLEEKNFNSVDDLTEKEMNYLLEISRDFFNNFFSKRKKIRLELIEKQEDIEKELRKVLEYVDFSE